MNAHKTVITQKGATRAAAELDIDCIAMEKIALTSTNVRRGRLAALNVALTPMEALNARALMAINYKTMEKRVLISMNAPVIKADVAILV